MACSCAFFDGNLVYVWSKFSYNREEILTKRGANMGTAKDAAYCVHIPRCHYSKEQVVWEENGYDQYSNKETWHYNFEEESKGDCEYSCLSKMIFGHMIKGNIYTDFDVKACRISAKTKDGAETFFSLDVMNNPKENHLFGKKIREECINEWNIWSSRYHYVGNFTLIPNRKKRGRHLQHKHKDLGERWDLLLQYCKDNWIDFTCEIEMTFLQYMQITMQQLYFKEIYDDLMVKLNEKEIGQYTDKEYLEWIEEWNDILINSSELTLLSFENMSNKECVARINRLIEVRSRMILAVLKVQRKVEVNVKI